MESTKTKEDFTDFYKAMLALDDAPLFSKNSMRRSYIQPNNCFIESYRGHAWIWLPGATKPVVAGKLEVDGNKLLFSDGKSYINRINSPASAASTKTISLYEPELPLKAGALPLLDKIFYSFSALIASAQKLAGRANPWSLHSRYLGLTI